MEINTATAIYTGGNIYIYYGQLEDNTYFRSCDTWECTEICNADTSTEDADYMEFYEEHSIKAIAGKEHREFFNKMLQWILEHKPDGNYVTYELEKRRYK